MKRFLIILFVVAFIAAIPLSHNLLAQKSANVLICHITHTGVNDNNFAIFTGHVIEISPKAVPAHCAHGDHNPVQLDKVKGDECKRKIEGAKAKCNGEDPGNPRWYKK